MKKYIVAGTYEQFLFWVNKRLENDILSQKQDFVYVSSPSVLRGLLQIEGYFVGTYKDRKDFQEIKTQIDIIKAIKNKSVDTKPEPWLKPTGNVLTATTIGQGHFSIVGSSSAVGKSTLQISPEFGDVKYDPITLGLRYWNGNTWETVAFART